MSDEGWRDEEQLNDFKWLMLNNFGLKWPSRFREIEKRFGGPPECLFNFSMFSSRCSRGPTLVACPPSDHYYPRFQKLLQWGIITKAADSTSTVEEELSGLKKDRLLEICNDLGIKASAQSTKAKLIELLKNHGEISRYIQTRTFSDMYNFTPLPGQVTERGKYEGPDEFATNSLSGSDQYTLNVKNWTCTCPDWEKRHANHEPGSPGRLCKHLLATIADYPELLPNDMLAFGIIMTDRFQHERGMPGNDAVYGTYDGMAYIIQRGDDGWVNFFINDKRFGYHPGKKRWANGKSPDGASALLAKARHCGFYQANGPSKAKEKDIGSVLLGHIVHLLILIFAIFAGVMLLCVVLG